MRTVFILIAVILGGCVVTPDAVTQPPTISKIEASKLRAQLAVITAQNAVKQDRVKPTPTDDIDPPAPDVDPVTPAPKPKNTTCTACEGSGRSGDGLSFCHRCKGSGREPGTGAAPEEMATCCKKVDVPVITVYSYPLDKIKTCPPCDALHTAAEFIKDFSFDSKHDTKSFPKWVIQKNEYPLLVWKTKKRDRYQAGWKGIANFRENYNRTIAQDGPPPSLKLESLEHVATPSVMGLPQTMIPYFAPRYTGPVYYRDWGHIAAWTWDGDLRQHMRWSPHSLSVSQIETASPEQLVRWHDQQHEGISRRAGVEKVEKNLAKREEKRRKKEEKTMRKQMAASPRRRSDNCADGSCNI